MELQVTGELSNELKRGAITPTDRKMVYKNIATGKYNILFSRAEADMCYLASVYYHSNIVLRVMSRLVDANLFVSTQKTDGVITRLLDGLLTRGWSNTFKQIAPDVDLKCFEKFVFKCYRYCVQSDDYFGLMPLITSYCVEIVGVPEVQLKSYLARGRMWRSAAKSDNANLYTLMHLYNTKVFKAIDYDLRQTWIDFIQNYTKDVKHEDKLLAIRDHANVLVVEHGAAYNFLVKACKELLL